MVSGTDHAIMRVREDEMESLHFSPQSIVPRLPCSRHYVPGSELGPRGRMVVRVQFCL